MEYVLNETTRTVHKRRIGTGNRHTVCGITRTIDADRLQPISTELVSTEYDADRCGRCFDGVGGY